MERAYIYGDSLLKATVPDAAMRYHFHLSEVMAQYPTERLEVVNRAKMGSTISKGLSLVEHDVSRGMDARWALVAYGGNDSDFDWPASPPTPRGPQAPHGAAGISVQIEADGNGIGPRGGAAGADDTSAY